MYTDPQGRAGLGDILADELVSPGPVAQDNAWEYGFENDNDDPCIFDCGL